MLEHLREEGVTMPMLRAAMALRQDELRHEFKRDMERVGATHTHMQFHLLVLSRL